MKKLCLQRPMNILRKHSRENLANYTHALRGY